MSPNAIRHNAMHLIFGLLALAGFCISIAVHLCALLGIGPPLSMDTLWPLHLGIFVVFVPMVLSSVRNGAGRARPTWRSMRARYPAWVVMAGALLMAYVALNFLLFMQGTEGGSAAVQGGKYVLQNHGKLIRELSAAEYARFESNVVRGFSGHWMIFYFIPFAHFLLRRKAGR